MAKKIKYPLMLKDDRRVYTMEELRESFDWEKIYEYFRNGKLAEWLEDRYYEEEARQVKKLNPQKDGAMKELCRILSVDSDRADLYEKYRLKPCTKEEWKEFLAASYEDIFDVAFYTTDSEYLGMICSIRFLCCLIPVIKGRQIAKKTRISINKLAYDYLTGHVGQPYAEIASLLEELTRLVNIEDFAALSGLELGEKLTNYMALSGCSSHNELTNIRRVNYIICTSLGNIYPLDFTDDTSDQEEELEEMIIKIYSVLFPDSITLFEGVMGDVYAPDTPGMDKTAFVIYDLITTIVLDGLNALSLDAIREALHSYVEKYEAVCAPKGQKTRILLKEIPEYYTNIWSVLEEMNNL